MVAVSLHLGSWQSSRGSCSWGCCCSFLGNCGVALVTLAGETTGVLVHLTGNLGCAADTCWGTLGGRATRHPHAAGCPRSRERMSHWNQREKSFPPAVFFQHPPLIPLSVMSAGREEMLQGPAPGSPSKAMKGRLKSNARSQ